MIAGPVLARTDITQRAPSRALLPDALSCDNHTAAGTNSPTGVDAESLERVMHFGERSRLFISIRRDFRSSERL